MYFGEEHKQYAHSRVEIGGRTDIETLRDMVKFIEASRKWIGSADYGQEAKVRWNKNRSSRACFGTCQFTRLLGLGDKHGTCSRGIL